ncbi:hypothetical protein [Bacillus sp. B15-48]|uniref:hypothetical protein n=1 Tax=Bacillus sp. B15-48 TaxID=1548601 RepID=UPI00193F620C|nr:hypothetical protein [Bacillus sp. B15-48]MBM4763074.1 hypothetical protein [Bacillus sp. B15-48]
MEIQSEELFNMPDLLFAQFCDEKFQINRGVLNVIDVWFYQRGLRQITKRRKTILSFVHYIHNNEQPSKKVKFGHGGLTTRLEQFWQQQEGRIKRVMEYAGK